MVTSLRYVNVTFSYYSLTLRSDTLALVAMPWSHEGNRYVCSFVTFKLRSSYVTLCFVELRYVNVTLRWVDVTFHHVKRDVVLRCLLSFPFRSVWFISHEFTSFL